MEVYLLLRLVQANQVANNYRCIFWQMSIVFDADIIEILSKLSGHHQ